MDIGFFFLTGLLFFILLYQEYRPADTNIISVEKVRSDGLVGDFICSKDEVGLPVVIFLGGSGGGLGNETELASLASNGYAVFSLAYFKEVGLPDKSENIPLEYFANAFDWLKTKPQVDTSKIILLGVSRGAELALLLGSTYPQVKGVIAYSPSCFMFPNATEVEKDTLVASWTLMNEPIPFVPIKRFEADCEEAVNYAEYIEPLLVKSDLLEEFMIKVEKINGPILLFSGARDLVWPATKMSARIERRLKEKGFNHKFINTVFADGGHDLFLFKNCLPVISSIAFKKIKLVIRGQQYEFNLGGTTLGVIESKIKSRAISLRFLNSVKNAN
jgi:dienelactone hydrolase